MVVNDIPGEECRIAILQNNHLEELYTERHATATDVGNIYKGKVINVEPAIQAAFIDYGQGNNGFLHVSDLHPKYFPGEERTERVGKKIPRRDRPPMQAALKRGQEILVQVLKEGIGTKGPTLTSYLSIPGRLLVMMPDMDRVGVSRKVEDEEKRREMRKILDSLNLPEGFGFILRTAGFGKTKTELKRDAAYLMRLWKVMEKRIKGAGAPCELYTESDLLIRTIRDVLRPSVSAIIVDSESAFDRVSLFLSVVAPRSAPKVLHYKRSAPIFHAFDIERQIELIHAREVPLPSGGRLVIDQTEALVAIDVNSGRSRSARDSETNAYETNIEATDEICRQLRLRDLGGLIVNDLIDMRSVKHRKAIEEQFTNNFKRDRARTTIAPISEFGILEMTRQRMRPSLRKAHFMDCPHCNGHGEIKNPDSVAADAVRHIGYLMQYGRVQRVEVACSPRVASVLLSAKRRELVRMEDDSGKRIDVRVSEAIAVDRVDYYAYDERNADIDISHLPTLARPSIEELEKEQDEPEAIVDGEESIDALDDNGGRRRRRRGGRGRRGPADATAIALAGNFDEELKALGYDEDEDDVIAGEDEEEDDADDSAAIQPLNDRSSQQPLPQQQQGGQPPMGQPGEGGRKRRRRRRGRRGRGGRLDQQQPMQPGDVPQTPPVGFETPPMDGIDANLVPGDQTTPLRIHELAKELNVSSSELIERAEPDPNVHHLTSPLSSVSSEEADVIRHMFAGDESLASQPLHVEGGGAPGIEPLAGGQASPGDGTGPRKKRRRRRGGRGRRRGHQMGQGAGEGFAQHGASGSEHGLQHPPHAQQGDAHDTDENDHDDADESQDSSATHGSPARRPDAHGGGDGQRSGRKRRRRRRGRGKGGSGDGSGGEGAESRPAINSHQPSTALDHLASAPASSGASASPQGAPARKPRRALYRAGRGRVTPRAGDAGTDDE